MSPRRGRARDLVAPFRGIRSPSPGAADAVGRARELAPLLASDQCFSHETAAALHRMRLLRSPGAVVHVTTFGGRRPMRRAEATGHRGDAACARAIVDGLPALTPVETWLHLAASESVDGLVVLGDGLLDRRRPLSTVADMTAAIADHRRLVGAIRLRRALELIRPGTDSARETELRLLLARAGHPEPEVNGQIRNEYGAVIAHGDLVWRRQRLIVEYDGDQHRTDRRQFAIDVDRIGALQSLGWFVLRVDAALFARQRVLLDRVAAALARMP